MGAIGHTVGTIGGPIKLIGTPIRDGLLPNSQGFFAMSNVIRKINRGGGLPGRTFERTQGCWNCIHYDVGERSRNYWFQKAKPRDEGHAKAYEFEGKMDAARAVRQTIEDAERAILTGKAGMCSAGKAKSEYVMSAYLCNHWSGRTGASVAREGGAPDLLPAELRDVVDGDGGGNGSE